MPSRSLSLRKKLLILLSSVILGLLVLLFSTNYFSYNIKQLENTKSSIQQLGIIVLELRRNEKDFIIRKQEKYLKKHQENYQKLLDELHILNQLNASNESDLNLNKLNESFTYYQEKFIQLSQAYFSKGLDKDSGKYGELRAATHKLEEIYKAHNDVDNHLLLLTIRRHEKDYMLRLDPAYIDKLHTVIAQLKQSSQNLPQASQLIDDYA